MFKFPKSLQVSGKEIPFVFGTGQKYQTVKRTETLFGGEEQYISSWRPQPEKEYDQHDKADHSGYLFVSLQRVMRVSPIYNGDEFAGSFSITLMTRAEHDLTNGSDDNLGWTDKLALGLEKKRLESGKQKINTRDLIEDKSAQGSLERKATEIGFKLHNVPIYQLPSIFMMAQRVYAEAGNMPPPNRRSQHGVPTTGM